MASNERKPKLEIPVSDNPRELDEVEVEMLFDSPYAYHEHNPDASYEVWYYTVRVIDSNEEMSVTAYSGLHTDIERTNYDVGATISLARIGEKKKTVWMCSYVSGPKRETNVVPTVQPALSANGANAPARAVQSSVWTPYNSSDTEVMLAIMDADLDLLEQSLALVSTREAFAEVSLDQQVRIAVGARINAGRVFRPGMRLASKEDDTPLMRFMLDVGSADEDGLLDAVTDALINYTELRDKDEVVNTIVKFGLSSASIKAGGRSELERTFNLCHEYARLAVQENMHESEALGAAADKYGVELPSDIPW